MEMDMERKFSLLCNALAVAAVLGVALLVCAIITAFVLFRLGKDYTEK